MKATDARGCIGDGVWDSKRQKSARSNLWFTRILERRVKHSQEIGVCGCKTE